MKKETDEFKGDMLSTAKPKATVLKLSLEADGSLHHPVALPL